jgi:hypothetical protein
MARYREDFIFCVELKLNSNTALSYKFIINTLIIHYIYFFFKLMFVVPETSDRYFTSCDKFYIHGPP